MKTRILILLVISVIAAACGHDPVASGANASPTPNASPPDTTVRPAWKKIELADYGAAFASYQDKIYVVGDKVTEIGPSLELRELPPLHLKSMVLSTDGGLTAEPMDVPEKTDEDVLNRELCSPNEAVFVPAGLYVTATCEHTAQLWKITFNKGASLVDVIHFTYRDGNGEDETVYWPFALAVSENTVLMPANLDAGPALMTRDPKTGLLKTVWQGKNKEGWIKSIDFKGPEGLMLMGGGQVLGSSDGGHSWQERGKVPVDLPEERARLKIGRGREDLVVVLKGQTLFTGDGGANWTREINPVDLEADTIAWDETMLIATERAAPDDSRRFLWARKTSGGGTWSKIESPAGDVRDILLLGGKLFVLVEGKLYYTDAGIF